MRSSSTFGSHLGRDRKEALEERKEIISPLGRWHDLVRQTDAMRTPYASDTTRHAHLFLPYDPANNLKLCGAA